MTRLIAIAAVWFACALAWLVLGSTLTFRTGDRFSSLNDEVHQLWGPEMSQKSPSGSFNREQVTSETQTVVENGESRKVTTEKKVVHAVPLDLQSSKVDAHLELEHRKKGLLWFPTYTVDFKGEYRFQNPSGESQEAGINVPLVTNNVGYDNFKIIDATSGKPMAFEISGEQARLTQEFEAGETKTLVVSYQTRGTSSWTYAMADGNGRVKNLDVNITTDFEKVDFPAGSVSPSSHSSTGDGWSGEWQYESLISSSPIAIQLPERINPGPLASRITFFAPLSLLFFFFVVGVLATVRRVQLHPMHYFFLGCAFFAFHLLFAYLVDHVAIFPAFGIAALVSVALVVSYARLFTGWKFAIREMAVSQLLYLVLFSYSFFWEGFTGLAITVGAIITLFVMMQVTGRVDWMSRIKGPMEGPPEPPQAPPSPEEQARSEVEGLLQGSAVAHGVDG